MKYKYLRRKNLPSYTYFITIYEREYSTYLESPCTEYSFVTLFSNYFYLEKMEIIYSALFFAFVVFPNSVGKYKITKKIDVQFFLVPLQKFCRGPNREA